MNSRDQHIVHSLRRWIQGDVDQRQERRLEEMAREDDFLREALDGYHRFPDGQHQVRLERLRQQLPPAERRHSGLLVSLPFRVAAAVAIVIIAGLFWFLNPGEQNALTRAEDADKQAAPALENAEVASSFSDDSMALAQSDPAALSPTMPAESRQEVPAQGEKAKEIPTHEKAATATGREGAEQRPDAAPSDPIAAEATPLGDTFRASSISSGNRLDTPVSAPPSPPPAAEGVTLGGVRLNSPQGTRLVTGQVLDHTGEPLGGVLVVTPGERTGIITNQNGQYEILLDSSVQRLEFQRVGYTSQRIAIPDAGGFVRVTLAEAAPLSSPGPAIAEESARRKTATAAEKRNPAVSGVPAGGAAAEPEGGFRRLERHLNRNLRYPESALAQGISGEVTVRFSVRPDGSIADAQAVSSPGGGLAEEAVRLLTTGPKWKAAQGSQEAVTVTYRITFKL